MPDLPLLTVAVRFRRADVTALLLEFGADPDRKTEGFLPPIHEAAVAGDAETVRVLLAAGARVPPRLAEGLRWLPANGPEEKALLLQISDLLKKHAVPPAPAPRSR